MPDDFFDDDFEVEDATVIGGLMGFIEEEEEEEKKRKKIEEEMFGLDVTEPGYDDEED